jgi:hypothetical protein
MTLLGELTGGDWTETIAGRELRLAPLSLADWAVVEARLVASRRDPITVARESLDSLPATAHRAVLEAALSEACRGGRVTIDELVDFAGTTAGTVLLVWLALGRHQPDLREADVAELLRHWTDADRAAAEPRLAGVPPARSDSAKNSPGQEVATATSRSPGEPSSATFPSDMVGRPAMSADSRSGS